MDPQKATALVLCQVNAPYSRNISAADLAHALSSLDAAWEEIGPVYAFLTEVEADTQLAFMQAHGVDRKAAAAVAEALSLRSGADLRLPARVVEASSA
ncbi:hypothetical protein CKO28_01050 [Rhodovibrio sodomensis]|uniref:Uncharacterized protein n=1 Tax=Rhodovibrio sodomensis TaxID=1088 RepID=A0ABS1D8E6_9PROT|nr:hypothetical protein [Rhodovibrio sodomensis]MBK1666630.1 hypothetical protein [Rhodovibrio sodomensis]